VKINLRRQYFSDMGKFVHPDATAEALLNQPMAISVASRPRVSYTGAAVGLRQVAPECRSDRRPITLWRTTPQTSYLALRREWILDRLSLHWNKDRQ
jgi:hypothetical protein